MHPILFKIGGFVLGTYGVLIVVGMLSGLWLIRRLAAREGGTPPDFFYDLLFCVMLAGFLGARVTYIALNWSQFIQAPMAMILSRQGFVFLGGFVAAVPAAAWLVRREGLSPWKVADLAAPGLVLGHAFGRIGCFLAGCCFGMACTPQAHPLLANVAIGFPVLRDAQGRLVEMFNFAYGTQVLSGLLPPTATRTLPMLPVQLLESLGNGLICLALLGIWRRRRFSGQVAAAYLMLYSVLRFALEFARGDVERGLFFGGRTGVRGVFAGGISTSQIVCLFTLAAGLGIWAWRRGKSVEPAPLGPGGEAPESGQPGTVAASAGRHHRKTSGKAPARHVDR